MVGASVLPLESRDKAVLRLRKSIVDARQDVQHLVNDLAGHGWGRASEFHGKGSKAGRPSTNLDRMKAEVETLRQIASWLHATVVELRGEPIFALGSGADRLAALGIISAPVEPVYRGQGRPVGRDSDLQIVSMVALVHAAYPALSQRRTLALVAEILGARRKATRSSVVDAAYYRRAAKNFGQAIDWRAIARKSSPKVAAKGSALDDVMRIWKKAKVSRQ